MVVRLSRFILKVYYRNFRRGILWDLELDEVKHQVKHLKWRWRAFGIAPCKESRPILDSGFQVLDSRYWIPDFCEWNLIDAPTCVLKCGTISKITRMASCTAFSLPCDPNATLTILGTVAVLAASSIEQNASVLVFSQQWRKLTNLTSLVISSIVLYLYLNCK